MSYVFLVENIEGEIEDCAITHELNTAIDLLITWAERNGVSLDPENSEVDIYIEEDDKEEYVSKVIDDNLGKAQIIFCEQEF